MKVELIERDFVKKIVSAPRRADTDKRDYGDLLIFAGKEGMAGAAILAAKAALRSGAGLVKVATPKSNFPIIQRTLPEAICIEEETALSSIDHYTAIVVGPGMGADERTSKIVEAVLERAPLRMPILIDADGLNVIAKSNNLKSIFCDRCRSIAEDTGKNEEMPSAAGFGSIVITPHSREAARLLGCEIATHSAQQGELPEEASKRTEVAAVKTREATCMELAEMYNCIALLKGSGTLIAAPRMVTTAEHEPERCSNDGSCAERCGVDRVCTKGLALKVYQNTTGNPGMATAGSGDVLSGIIGALMAQGVAPIDAAVSAAFIHGLAGDIAAEKLGERSVIASDIIDALPEIFKKLAAF